MKKQELVEKTKLELMEIARKSGLAGRSGMNKDELVSSLAKLLKDKKSTSAKKMVNIKTSVKKQEVKGKVAERPEKAATKKLATPEKKRVPAKAEKKPALVRKAKSSIGKRGETAVVVPAAAGKAETWQEKVEDTKFYTGAEERAFVTEEELPAGYGDNRVVLMVRDPHWAYAYWEINSRKIAEARNTLKAVFDQSNLILRVYDITGIAFTGFNSNAHFDIEIPNVLGNWYVNLGAPNRAFCIDIGYRKPDGGIFVLSRSNTITSPRDTFSEVSDEKWMGSDEEHKRIYARSGGVGYLGASAEVAEMIKKRREKEISSGGVRGLEPKETSHKR